MRLIAALIVTSVVCLCAAPAVASEWSMEKWAKRESGWKGHGVGSSVTKTMTMKMPKMPNVPNMPNIPGMPKGGKMVTTTKTTLTKITKDGYVLTEETTSMGQKTTTTRTEPKVRTINLKAIVKDGGEGAVTVAGKSYPCKIRIVTNMESFLGGMKPKRPGGSRGGMPEPKMGQGKVWEHAKLGVLKMQTSTSMMGQKITMTWQVSKFSASHTIGKTTVTGREMTMTSSHAMGSSTITMLAVPTFPEGTVKSVMTSKTPMGNTTSTTVVTAYVKKPITATTPAAGK